jgi:hypothetical protein
VQKCSWRTAGVLTHYIHIMCDKGSALWTHKAGCAAAHHHPWEVDIYASYANILGDTEPAHADC